MTPLVCLSNLRLELSRRFDIENSGYIRKDDLLQVLECETEVTQVMRELDVNGDGKISYEEFIGALHDSEKGKSRTLPNG